MSETQGAAAPQAQAAAQTQPNAEAVKPQGQGAPGAVGDQKGSAVSEAAKEAIRKHKLKVDGQEVEVDDEELKRGYGLQKVATKRMQEGLAAKRQAEEFVKMLRDPEQLDTLLEKLGHKPRELYEQKLAAKLKYEMMDPKEREFLETKRERDALAAEKKALMEAKEKEQIDKLKEHFTQKYNTEIVEALKDTPIPQNKNSVARMAEYIAKAAKAKIPMSAKEAAILVQQDLEEVQTRIYKDATPEQLIKLLGEEGLQKLRAYDTAKLRSPEANLVTPPDQGDVQPRKRNSSGRMSPKEWREFNRR